jgi:hydroxyacylglutathione hydrolase
MLTQRLRALKYSLSLPAPASIIAAPEEAPMGFSIRLVIADPLFQSNCYIVGCPDTAEGIVIDPGIRIGDIAAAVKEEGIQVTAVVNTHGHLDHVAGAAEARRIFNAPFLLHEAESVILANLDNSAANFGLPPVEHPQVDRWLTDGEVVKFGKQSLKVLHTPGHTPGGICLLGDGHLFSGDTIFSGSIGRHDFFGGDFETLMNSIMNRILTLPEETVIHPGHGPETTVGREKALNPFLQ